MIYIDNYNIIVDKGKGNLFGSTIRKYVMMASESWRCIAFRVIDKDFTILNSGDNRMQTSIEIANTLSKVNIDFGDDKNHVVLQITKNSVIRVSDLGGTLLSEDTEILNSFDSSDISMEFIFRRNMGSAQQNENNLYIMESIPEANATDFFIFATFHNVVDFLTFQIKETGVEHETVIFSGGSDTSDVNLEDLIKNTVENLIYDFKSILT